MMHIDASLILLMSMSTLRVIVELGRHGGRYSERGTVIYNNDDDEDEVEEHLENYPLPVATYPLAGEGSRIRLIVLSK